MILLDTIAYNTFLSCVRGEKYRKIKGLNEENFKKFILNYNGEKYIHSATLFELYMKDLKSSEVNDFKKFIEDFNALNKYGFRILNDSTWNFDWQSLVGAYENGESYDMGVYIESKVDYEVISISRYFMCIFLIVSEELFDKYNDQVGIDLFRDTINFNRGLIESKLREYLFRYYLTDENKETSTKKFDSLLGYVLEKLEEIIKKELTLIYRFTDSEEFLIKQYHDYEYMEELNISGTQKAKEILKGKKGKELNRLIISQIEAFEATVISEDRRFLTDNEKLYLTTVILPKALQQGYKVTKNDFTDCSIFSAFDCLANGQEGTLITFDNTLQALSKQKNVFYDEEIYNEFMI